MQLNNAGIDKEEENKLARPLTKKELPAEGCSRRNGKGKYSRFAVEEDIYTN